MKTKILLCVLLMAAGLLSGCGEKLKPILEPTRESTIAEMKLYAEVINIVHLVQFFAGEMGKDEQKIVTGIVNLGYARLTSLYHRFWTEGDIELEQAYKQATAARDDWLNREPENF